MSLYNTLKEKFDRIYILNLVTRKDRKENIERQFKELGLPLPDTTEFIKYYYAVPFPYNAVITDAFNRTGTGKFTKPNEYDCSRNHYNIIKISYELGYQRILIIEDDILFLKSADEIKRYLENMPSDANICQFGCFSADPRLPRILEDYSIGNSDWVLMDKIGVWNTSGLCYDRIGMEYYLAFMDKIFWVADGPLYKAPCNSRLVKYYLSRKPVVIQADKDIMKSDIRDESTDDIDYKNQNIYERGIDKEKYFNV